MDHHIVLGSLQVVQFKVLNLLADYHEPWCKRFAVETSQISCI